METGNSTITTRANAVPGRPPSDFFGTQRAWCPRVPRSSCNAKAFRTDRNTDQTRTHQRQRTQPTCSRGSPTTKSKESQESHFPPELQILYGDAVM
jgi:hypothetical protein